MRAFFGYCMGLIGFLMQGTAAVVLPVYVIFLGGSGWWMLACIPLGMLGMVPLSIAHRLIEGRPQG